MRRIKLTVEQHSNGALSLWIEDEAFGREGRLEVGTLWQKTETMRASIGR